MNKYTKEERLSVRNVLDRICSDFSMGCEGCPLNGIDGACHSKKIADYLRRRMTATNGMKFKGAFGSKLTDVVSMPKDKLLEWTLEPYHDAVGITPSEYSCYSVTADKICLDSSCERCPFNVKREDTSICFKRRIDGCISAYLAETRSDRFFKLFGFPLSVLLAWRRERQDTWADEPFNPKGVKEDE